MKCVRIRDHEPGDRLSIICAGMTCKTENANMKSTSYQCTSSSQIVCKECWMDHPQSECNTLDALNCKTMIDHPKGGSDNFGAVNNTNMINKQGTIENQQAIIEKLKIDNYGLQAEHKIFKDKFKDCESENTFQKRLFAHTYGSAKKKEASALAHGLIYICSTFIRKNNIYNRICSKNRRK